MRQLIGHLRTGSTKNFLLGGIEESSHRKSAKGNSRRHSPDPAPDTLDVQPGIFSHAFGRARLEMLSR
jgi:hypothetical protein